MTDDPSLQKLLSDLDDATIEGLRELLLNDSELLREILVDLGYVPVSNAQTDQDLSKETLSPAQQQIRAALENMGGPRTAEEVIELLEREHRDILNEYQSAKHRPWMSTQLNELVDAGELGRFRDGRTIRYTLRPAEAVRHWALHNNRFVEELDTSDARTIAEDTAMPTLVVRRAINDLQERT